MPRFKFKQHAVIVNNRDLAIVNYPDMYGTRKDKSGNTFINIIQDKTNVRAFCHGLKYGSRSQTLYAGTVAVVLRHENVFMLDRLKNNRVGVRRKPDLESADGSWKYFNDYSKKHMLVLIDNIIIAVKSNALKYFEPVDNALERRDVIIKLESEINLKNASDKDIEEIKQLLLRRKYKGHTLQSKIVSVETVTKPIVESNDTLNDNTVEKL